MRMFVLPALAAAGALSLAACSPQHQEKAKADTQAAAAKVGDAAKEVAASPEVKAVGSDIKVGAAEAAQATKEATQEAAVQAGDAAKDLAADVRKSAAEARQNAAEAKARADAKAAAEKK